MGRADESTSGCTPATTAATATTTAATATAVSTSGSPHTGAGWAAERPARLLPFLHTAVVRRWATGQAMRQAVGEAVPRPGPGRQHRRLTLTHTYTLMHTHTRTGEPRGSVPRKRRSISPHIASEEKGGESTARPYADPVPGPMSCRVPATPNSPPGSHPCRTCPRTHPKEVRLTFGPKSDATIFENSFS